MRMESRLHVFLLGVATYRLTISLVAVHCCLLFAVLLTVLIVDQFSVCPSPSRNWEGKAYIKLMKNDERTN